MYLLYIRKFLELLKQFFIIIIKGTFHVFYNAFYRYIFGRVIKGALLLISTNLHFAVSFKMKFMINIKKDGVLQKCNNWIWEPLWWRGCLLLLVSFFCQNEHYIYQFFSECVTLRRNFDIYFDYILFSK